MADKEKMNNTTYVQDDGTQSKNTQIQYNDIAFQKESNKHEEAMQKLENDKKLTEQLNELGKMGKFFGGEKIASKNITALVIIGLILVATVFSFVVYLKEKDIDSIDKMWSYIMPVVTVSIGYFFGNK